MEHLVGNVEQEKPLSFLPSQNVTPRGRSAAGFGFPDQPSFARFYSNFAVHRPMLAIGPTNFDSQPYGETHQGRQGARKQPTIALHRRRGERMPESPDCAGEQRNANYRVCRSWPHVEPLRCRQVLFRKRTPELHL